MRIKHKPDPQRRRLVQQFAALGVVVAGAATGSLIVQHSAWASSAQKPLIEVWKSPTCGCCGDWIKHLQANGFIVKSYDTGNVAKRSEVGMPLKYGSCHTAKINGYVLEGHVPAKEIHRLLKEKPAALGLAVPEMPVGSPGMDGPEYGGRVDPYDVLLVNKDGSASVYQGYRTPKSLR